MFSFDGRFPRTLRELVPGPGHVARRYVDGKRVAYVHPFLFALQTSALWFLTLKVVLESLGQQLPALLVYGQALNLIILCLLAPVLKLTFAGASQTVAEYLCLLFYIGGLAFLWRAALSLVNLAQLPPDVAVWANRLDLALFFVVTCVGLWQFHAGRVRWLALRVAASYLAFVGLSILATVVAQWVLG